MRRRDREITNKSEIQEILERGIVCNIAFHGEEWPYVVPVNYGFLYDGGLVLYFHGANQGKKLDLMEKNAKVAFSIGQNYDIIRGPDACSYSMNYESVLGYGTLSLVTDDSEKQRGLDSLMIHCGYEGEIKYTPGVFARTAILKLTVDSFSVKKLDEKPV